MLFWKSREKKFKMIWEVLKDGRRSLLIGTAHFFPYTFKRTFRKILSGTQTVAFEGPLDEENMAKVVRAGTVAADSYHLFDDLDPQTVTAISDALKPACRDPNSFFIMDLCKMRLENPIYDLVKGMKFWLAFFTIWSDYLRENGWKHSVDYEAYSVARELGKKIVFFESIEEQIKVLESLSRERIIEFLKNVDQWPQLAEAYVQSYLDGDLDKMRYMRLRFPSRHHSVIDHRDQIFYDRMQDYLKQGDLAFFVGAPHVRGIQKLLLEDGYEVRKGSGF